MRKKHSYLLLELLIAFALLSLFLAPLISAPFSSLRKQKKEIEACFLTLEAERLLISLEEKLRTSQIPLPEDRDLISKETLLIQNQKYIVCSYLALGAWTDNFGPVTCLIEIFAADQKLLSLEQTLLVERCKS